MDQSSNFQCCCSQLDCPRLIDFNESFKKVEYDAMLAAEIGQALLQEKVDTNEAEEEDNLIAYDTIKNNLLELKQLRWEKEKSDGLINVLQEEIKSLKTTTNDMKKKIDTYEKELEKKKLCDKLLVIKSDIEEELKTQVSDLKQELCQLQKSENNVRLKYKRLESNYERIQLTHDELSKEHDTLLDSISKKMLRDQPQQSLVSSVYQKNACHVTCNNKDMSSCAPEPIANTIHNHKQIVPQFRVSHMNCNKDPYEVLQSVTQQTIEKINATDTRVLNRRLRRVFDMSELSDMSNSILNNILSDLSDFKSQFDWVHDYGTTTSHTTTTRHFFLLVSSIQQLLQEISTNKMTLNDLQADYVKRIERLTNSQCSSLVDGNMLRRHHSAAAATATVAAAASADTTLGEKQQLIIASANSNNQKSFLQELFSLFTIH